MFATFFHELKAAVVFDGQFFQHGPQLLARLTPGRPEIDDDRTLGRARTLARLGRAAEAERALAAAAVFDRGATLEKRTGLYPHP